MRLHLDIFGLVIRLVMVFDERAGGLDPFGFPAVLLEVL